jgi:hypothetical protein
MAPTDCSDGTARLAFWLGTFPIVLWAMVRAADREWLVRPGHFAERPAGTNAGEDSRCASLNPVEIFDR